MSELTDKQIKFCEEYLIDLNATQSAIRAGYSRNSAMEQGYQLLQKTSVTEYLAKRQAELQQATGITQKRVLEEYAKVAFLDIRKFYTVDGALKSIHELDDDSAGALAGVEVYEEKAGNDAEEMVLGTTKKIKTYDKVKALDSLGRHLGLFGKDNEQLKPVVNITGMKVT